MIEQLIEREYEKTYTPALVDYRILVHPDVMAAGEWTEGQYLTKYKLPIYSALAINSYPMSDGKSYQSDIHIVGKLRHHRKFRHYRTLK